MSDTAPRRSTHLALLAAFVVALVAIAYLWVRLGQVEDDRAADHDQLVRLTDEKAAGADALASARSLLVDMTSYSWKSVAEDFTWLDRIGDDQLRTRMQKNVKALTKIITSSKARAKGEVIDAASRVVDSDQVEILAFVDQVIRDGEAKGYKVEEQRISMTMVHDGDEWLIDRLDLQSGNNAG